MRSFPIAATIRSAFLCLMVLPASTPAQGMQPEAETGAPMAATVQPQPEWHSDWSAPVDLPLERLDGRDRATALRALHVALDELSDGATLIWRKRSLKLEGAIQPTSAFRDGKGRVCRHLTYQLRVADYRKQIKGIACRQNDGSWSLSG